MTRRGASRAELSRRLDARRGEPPSPPAEAPRALTCMESNPRNSLPSAEDSIFLPPKKRKLIVSDKDGDRHSSECAYHTVVYKSAEVDGGEDEQGTNHFCVPSKRQKQRSLSIAAYAVQCTTCERWRLIPTRQKYEEIRAQIQKDLFKCEKACKWMPDVTCNTPSDVSQDDSWLWAMDKHNIPQPPQGFRRLIAIRSEGCTKFADVYYTTPTGRKLRSSKEVENYLNENPEYAAQGVNLSQFSFKIPAPARQDYVRKRAKTNQNDGSCKESSKPVRKEGEDTLPILTALCRYPPSKYTASAQPVAGSAPPTLEEPGDNNQLVPFDASPADLLQPEPLDMKLGNPPQQPAA